MGPKVEDKKRGESVSAGCLKLREVSQTDFLTSLVGWLDCSSRSDSGAWCEVGEREKIRTKRGRGRGKSR